ncbi:MAG: DUF3180 domain-containing protein [Candidatus Nanopelagicales bacterium]
MKPTRIRLLLAIAVIAASLGWGAASLVSSRTGRYLAVPWTAPITLLVLGIAIILWTRGVRARLAGMTGTRPLHPIVAARTAALAMAASRTGAFFGGFYLGVGIELVPNWAISVAADRVLLCAGSVLAALLVVVAALWLEHSCRLPDPPADGALERQSTPAPG